MFNYSGLAEAKINRFTNSTGKAITKICNNQYNNRHFLWI